MSCYVWHHGDVLLAAESDRPRAWRRVRTMLIREDSRERFGAELRERRRRQPVTD